MKQSMPVTKTGVKDGFMRTSWSPDLVGIIRIDHKDHSSLAKSLWAVHYIGPRYSRELDSWIIISSVFLHFCHRTVKTPRKRKPHDFFLFWISMRSVVNYSSYFLYLTPESVQKISHHYWIKRSLVSLFYAGEIVTWWLWVSGTQVLTSSRTRPLKLCNTQKFYMLIMKWLKSNQKVLWLGTESLCGNIVIFMEFVACRFRSWVRETESFNDIYDSIWTVISYLNNKTVVSSNSL